jgi:L-ascorbate metabolism protein UlaG (beta-lactamase superfamily)
MRWAKLVLGLAFVVAQIGAASGAACDSKVARDKPKPPIHLAALPPEGSVGLTFLGHASFLIESPQGVRVVTDYNDYLRPPSTPDVVTMNMAHSTHYSASPEPGIKVVLRGWDPGGGVAQYDTAYGDVRIRSIPTNIRDFGATRRAGNSIFIFEVEGVCIVHLGHLHHTLTAQHLGNLGKVDVLLAAVDGTYTMAHDDMVQTVNDIGPSTLVPMHYFGSLVLETFLGKLGPGWPVRHHKASFVELSKATLPNPPEVVVLPGR